MGLSNVEIGRRMRMMRQRCAISQKEVAKVLGVTFQQVQKYEKGTNRLSVEALVRLRECLGVDILQEDMSAAGGELSKAEHALLRSYRNIKNPDLQRKVLFLVKEITSRP